jgi:hypothetical protein
MSLIFKLLKYIFESQGMMFNKSSTKIFLLLYITSMTSVFFPSPSRAEDSLSEQDSYSRAQKRQEWANEQIVQGIYLAQFEIAFSEYYENKISPRDQKKLITRALQISVPDDQKIADYISHLKADLADKGSIYESTLQFANDLQGRIGGIENFKMARAEMACFSMVLEGDFKNAFLRPRDGARLLMWKFVSEQLGINENNRSRCSVAIRNLNSYIAQAPNRIPDESLKKTAALARECIEHSFRDCDSAIDQAQIAMPESGESTNTTQNGRSAVHSETAYQGSVSSPPADSPLAAAALPKSPSSSAKSDSEASARISSKEQVETNDESPSVPQRHPDFNFAVRAGGSILFILFAGIIIKRFIRRIRQARIKQRIIKEYSNLSDSGDFASAERHTIAYSKHNKIAPTDKIDILPITIKLAKPLSSNIGTWTAAIGSFDATSYNAAMNAYTIAHATWKAAKATAENQARELARQNGGITPFGAGGGFGSGPNKPSKKQFISYIKRKGKCLAEMQHPRILLSTATSICSDICGEVTIELKNLEENFIEIYEPVFRSIEKRQVNLRNNEKGLSLNVLDVESLRKMFSKTIAKRLMSDAEKAMGPYHKSEEIEYETTFSMTELDFPLTLVLVRSAKGKTIYGFQDCFFPEMVHFS